MLHAIGVNMPILQVRQMSNISTFRFVFTDRSFIRLTEQEYSTLPTDVSYKLYDKHIV